MRNTTENDSSSPVYLKLSGLEAEVRVTFDQWEVPHIEAASASDVFFAQGYIVAGQRLFQMDLWRRQGLGRLSEVYGSAFVDNDFAARHFVYRGDMRAEWLSYGTRAKQYITRFVEGINAYVHEVTADESQRPLEFRSLGILPALWEPEDILRIRNHGLYFNLEEEVARAETLRDFGDDIESIRRVREPEIRVVVPEGLDLVDIDRSILEIYRKARTPVVLVKDGGLVGGSTSSDGSNNWAIAPERTATGRAILATDPHRAMSFPGLRYICHLKCPEFDVIGANESYMPGISIGHNGSVAYSYTIAPIDGEDLYVYELHPDDPSLYRYNDTWERMVEVTENIAVRDSESITRTVQFTRHGPVLKVNEAANRAFALRATWLGAGMVPYLASLDLLGATDIQDYRVGLQRWGAPGLNQIIADTHGQIAWQSVGTAPIRPNWDGLLPVPGDGRYEWQGFHQIDEFPHLENPSSGWLRSANQYNHPEVPDWSPITLSYEWYADFRARRLASELDGARDWTVASTAELQNDYFSVAAEEAIRHLTSPFAEGSAAEVARALLLDWDCMMTADSAAAAIANEWLYGHLRKQLRTEYVRRVVPGEKQTAAIEALLNEDLETIGDPRVDLALLEACGSWEPSATFTSKLALLQDTLEATMSQLRKQLGDDPSAWTWGSMHVSQLFHPLHGLRGIDESLTDTGSHPKHGNGDTVGVAMDKNGVQTLGASVRMVFDVGAWDNSLAINMPGQTGNIEDAGAQGLYDLWLNDGYFPLSYTSEAIHKHAARTVIIGPKTDVSAGDPITTKAGNVK